MKRNGLILLGVLSVIGAAVAAFGIIFFYRHLAVAPSPPLWSLPVEPGGPSVPLPTSSPVQSRTAWLAPAAGPVGTVVVIHGSGFRPTGNTIEMNGLISGGMKDVASPDGVTLSFTVPSSLGANCAPSQPCPLFLALVKPGDYKVSVITGGVTQNIGTFAVTGAAQ